MDRQFISEPPRTMTDEALAHRWLHLAMNIGKYMIKSGAEISRVEDTMYRICRSFGVEEVDVFVITSSIVSTLYSPEIGHVTQTKRVGPMKYNLDRLDHLNQLSRSICAGMEIEEAEAAYEQVMARPIYGFRTYVVLYAISAAAFCILFGGNVRDALAASLIGIVLKFMDELTKRLEMNGFLSGFVCSLTGGILVTLAVRCGLGEHFSKISIADIMLLIPGLALTNSIRDMFSGDTISGVNRFIEAILLSIMIASGFALVSLWT
ncbi:MAG: threonine/serine exporter family protein [Lachnospiraceae bacterium]|nr:threonine/serine exporter family protein [Lachnospiraceae bacterium]